ncbi:MAG: NAD-binding protein [Syntrophobacteraceae bacterium]|jgi:voltage-gated potassium channel|nr:NAD-binding protein [Syntrophobacteraceae bacterium]
MSEGGKGSEPSRVLIADASIARQLLERLVVPAAVLGLTFLFGTLGYRVIGAGRWSLFDCAYMTSITLTSVGYGEILDQMGTGARAFTMLLMWTGMGVTLYAISTITAFLVEADFRRILRERRMEKKIGALRGHVVVCGLGKTGLNIIQEMHATRRPCVAIDDSSENLQKAQQRFSGLCYLLGNATDEDILRRAGIEKADGIVAALKNDSDNLLITVQARYINSGIRIVARCEENSLADKFYRAGANRVVNPAFIGGMRMASEILRPHVVSFLDRMLRGRDGSIRVEEAEVLEDSPWAGHTLRELEIHRKTGLLVIAVKHPDREDFEYNPPAEEILRAGTVVIVIGNAEQMGQLRGLCGPGG